MNKPWEGKHLWYWENLPPAPEIIAQAKQLGLAGLLVKGWDGTDSERWLQQVKTLVEPAHAAGLVIGAWGYCYGVDPVGEAAAAKACIKAGGDWLVLDVEDEFEQHPERIAGPDGFRAAFWNAFQGKVPIGYSSFGLPDEHPAFPWATLSVMCRVALPQVYWADFGIPVEQALRESIAQTGRYGLPVMPAGQVITDSGAAVLPRDVVAFGAQALAAGCPGISFWRAGGDIREDLLAAVEAIKWEEVIPVPEQWKLDLEAWAKANGIISQEHNPDTTEPGWFALAVAKNLYQKFDGRILALEEAVANLQPQNGAQK